MKFQVVDPLKVAFKLEVTFTLAQWLEIKAVIDRTEHNWCGPAGNLKAAIQDMTIKAKQQFVAEEKVDTE